MSRGRAIAIGLLLAAFLIARAVATFVPSMWAWGVNAGRFLPPGLAWALWAVAVVALIPPVGRAWARAADQAGEGLVRSRLAWPLAGGLAALTVFALPDRTWFIGDFQIRAGSAAVAGAFAGNFSGAMPVDWFLHGFLAGPLSAAFGADPTFAARLFGALEAAGLAWLGIALARHLGHRGAVALMVVCIVAGGGWLATFTGLGKPASEMVLVTVAVGVFGAIAVRNPRARLGAGIALAVGLLSHRSAVMLVPAWVASWFVSLGAEREPEARPAPRWMTWLALLVPLLTIALAMGRIDPLLRGYDLEHHLLPPEVVRQGGPLRAAVGPVRLTDLGSLLLVMCPALVTLPALAGTPGSSRDRRRGSRRDGIIPGTLALAALPVWLFIHAQQGVFRDWDVYAPAGAALALFAAFLLAEALRDGHRHAWLAVPVTVMTVTSTLGWLVLAHQPDRNLARVRAWLTEAPDRPEALRATTWDFVAARELRLGRYEASAAAAEQAAALAPHRRVLLTWGIAATMARDHDRARRAYRMLLERAPDDPLAWLGLGGIAVRDGDSLAAREALSRLDRHAPGSPQAREIRRHRAFFPEVWPDSLPVNLRAN